MGGVAGELVDRRFSFRRGRSLFFVEGGGGFWFRRRGVLARACMWGYRFRYGELCDYVYIKV